LSAFGSKDKGIIHLPWRFISRNGFCYKAHDISVRTQRVTPTTKYTTVTVQSGNIHHNQGYGYIFRTMLHIFKPISCNIKFSYLRYNAYQVSEL